MKIKVVSRAFFMALKENEAEEDAFLKKINLISINTPAAPGFEYGISTFEEEFCPINEKHWEDENVLILKFHDVSQDTTIKVNGIECHFTLMSMGDGFMIKDFVDHMDKSKTLFVHCTAGISRSQTVAMILNDYFNRFLENNPKDFQEFEERNSRIRSVNLHVKKIMMDCFFKS